MADGRPNSVFRRVLRAVRPDASGDLTDARLLERFVAARDEAAFAALFWRHAPMVLGLCRRVLRHEQDAEDAFQATFLALARKAGSIGKGAALAGWLYKVAFRIALRARADAALRGEREAPRPDLSAAPVPERVAPELPPALDEEVSRLPAPFRDAFVLHYLQGLSTEQVARALGCPKGTVLSRLSRARARLREQLARRGLAVPAALFGVVLAEAVAPAMVPTPLAEVTLVAAMRFAAGLAAPVSPAVAALAKGAVRTMSLTTRTVLVAAVVASLALGAGFLSHVARATGRTGDPGVVSLSDDAPKSLADGRAEVVRKRKVFPEGSTVGIFWQTNEVHDKCQLDKPEQLTELASFFPELDGGRPGRPVGDWADIGKGRPQVIVIFYVAGRKEDNEVWVHIDPGYRKWSSGEHEWDAPPGLKKHLDAILRAQRAERALPPPPFAPKPADPEPQ
jgi:RNA polymerase sigma factor (sigma-70 family)